MENAWVSRTVPRTLGTVSLNRSKPQCFKGQFLNERLKKKTYGVLSEKLLQNSMSQNKQMDKVECTNL